MLRLCCFVSYGAPGRFGRPNAGDGLPLGCSTSPAGSLGRTLVHGGYLRPLRTPFIAALAAGAAPLTLHHIQTEIRRVQASPYAVRFIFSGIFSIKHVALNLLGLLPLRG
jgi:hypothetical protein